MNKNSYNKEPLKQTELCYIPYYDNTKEERYYRFREKHGDCRWHELVTYVNLNLDRDFYSEIQKVNNPGKLTVLVNKFRQLDQDYIPEDLEMIAPEFNSGELLLRHNARIAFEAMCRAAASEGLHMEAISTYRSYSYQNQVYYKNITPEITLEAYRLIRDKVSARAGHSEHQTGLAVDINDLEQTFDTTAEGIWLAANSYRYGFLLRYPKGKEWITGYDYEPWHFRYLGPELAREVYLSNLTYDEYYIRNIEGANITYI